MLSVNSRSTREVPWYPYDLFRPVQSVDVADRERGVPNDAAAWSDFDADRYWHNNYASVLPEDAEIIRCASKFLIESCGTTSPYKRAVDVGAGANLYPGLLMLPWAKQIVFTEYASPN